MPFFEGPVSNIEQLLLVTFHYRKFNGVVKLRHFEPVLYQMDAFTHFTPLSNRRINRIALNGIPFEFELSFGAKV